MLKTGSVKNWFRAYLNLGLMEKVLGNDRLIPCTAASDFVFVDPWSDVYACNVRNDLLIGNLKEQDHGMKFITVIVPCKYVKRLRPVHKIAGWWVQHALPCGILSLPNFPNRSQWVGHGQQTSCDSRLADSI